MFTNYNVAETHHNVIRILLHMILIYQRCTMKTIVIASFYKFVALPDFETMKVPMLNKMHELQIKGTIILAQEGINGGFAGSREQMDIFYQFMHNEPLFKDLNFKETSDEKKPF